MIVDRMQNFAFASRGLSVQIHKAPKQIQQLVYAATVFARVAKVCTVQQAPVFVQDHRVISPTVLLSILKITANVET
jgi:hypothetical protein